MYEDEYDVRRGIKRYITIVFYVFFGLIFLGIYCVKRLKKGIKKLKERNWDCLIDFIAFSSYFIYFLYGAIILSFIYTCIPEKVNGYEILLNIPIYLNNLLLIAGLF